uniref:G-type lectin S-receptor-like serine/threonine-protein kinase At1g61550 isoform X3 n=1 Tax=Fragaria vesca subsp. vesca TaxID=101020 RepID=UPI0005C98141|nr:PREDICTED: G-type lectin S-receptor-like serine/threonine-protein kinase At1g61550 isoform X3 [Fragaria vesca subsp. vesca]
MQLGCVTLFFLFIFSLLPSQYGAEVYNITPSHPLAEGQTLVSPSQIFELGFFRPNSSANKYVGLWHKSIFPRKIVWVANRDNPLAVTDTLATLRIGSSGSLELVDGKQSSVWSANISNCSFAVLLDIGNFVVKDVMGADLWDSFNNPSDSQLPYMLLGYDRSSGKRNFLTSWRSENDPSPGIFSTGLSADLPAQSFIWINGSTPYWRSGPWDKSRYIGIPSFNSQYQSPFTLVDNETQGTRYFSFSPDNFPADKPFAYMDMSSEGKLSFMLSVSGKNWSVDWQSSKNPCDIYGACGPFGVCKALESPICKCLKGFIPKSNEEWGKRNWTGGCVRRTNLFCENNTNNSVSSKGKDGFLKLERLEVPDFHEYRYSISVDKFEDCKIQCLSNCSCLAYAYVNNLGCLVWYKDLIDIQQFPSFGEDLYVRLADSELGRGKPIKLIASLSLTAIGLMSILVAIVFRLLRWHANQKRDVKSTTPHLKSTGLIKIYRDDLREYLGKHDLSELKIYDFDSILIATDSFSITNKLGQGGFGPVYKGMLPEGKEVAVKRLSSSSGQGVEEFKNEMLLISNLQHKNLVRIMGCCIKEDEKLLIYEFMPNKSLDTFLFDPRKRAVLNWATRFNIIQGVAKGLLYLHHDSYVKVIHRDLKVSNILLDEKMNPKISDFGLARIVEGTQSLENTQKWLYVSGVCHGWGLFRKI